MLIRRRTASIRAGICESRRAKLCLRASCVSRFVRLRFQFPECMIVSYACEVNERAIVYILNGSAFVISLTSTGKSIMAAVECGNGFNENLYISTRNCSSVFHILASHSDNGIEAVRNSNPSR